MPDLPVPFVLASALAALGVVVVTGVVAAVVVRDAVSEPLSAQIAGVRRPTKASRAVVVLRLALVALAAAALVTAASRDHPDKPDATDLALPILLAVAAGLLVGPGSCSPWRGSGCAGPRGAARSRRTSPRAPCVVVARARW